MKDKLLARRHITPAGCWEWTGGRTSAGYGETRRPVTQQVVYVHRVAFELWHRPLKPGEVVRHRCDNPPCFNPDHLLAGTQADNVADAVRRGRAVPGGKVLGDDVPCPDGHTGDFYRSPTGQGRKCRICKRQRDNAAARSRRIKETK